MKLSGSWRAEQHKIFISGNPSACPSQRARHQRCTQPRMKAGIGTGSLKGVDIESLKTPYSTETGWHSLSQPLVWKGTEAEAMQQNAWPQTLPPSWKVLLLSDGSVTRHLQIMTNMKVKVDCLEMKDLKRDAQDLPPGVANISGPLLQRQVFLRTPEEKGLDNRVKPGSALVYAASWWNAKEARDKLSKQDQPIWTSLQGTELRRDLQMVYCGNSSFLEESFGCEGPFWGRDYVFYSNGGKPLTVIYEVFSNKLDSYLGPLRQEWHLE